MQRREFINLSSLFSIILIIFNIKILIDTLNLKQYDIINFIDEEVMRYYFRQFNILLWKDD